MILREFCISCCCLFASAFLENTPTQDRLRLKLRPVPDNFASIQVSIFLEALPNSFFLNCVQWKFELSQLATMFVVVVVQNYSDMLTLGFFHHWLISFSFEPTDICVLR